MDGQIRPDLDPSAIAMAACPTPYLCGLLPLLSATAIALGGSAQSAPILSAEALSRAPLPETADWRRHILNAPGEFALPRAVSIEGDGGSVVDAKALLGSGGATLTTTKAHGVRIVIDFGVLVSGYVELKVRSASGAPIRLSYAESRSRLGLEGDASPNPGDFFYRGRTLAPEDDPDGRTDVFVPPTGSATLTSPGLRGAERFVAITLDAPGSVTLEALRVRQTNYSGAYDGYFLSNDETLTRAWFASAYALNLSTARDLRSTPPGAWVILDGPKRDRVAYAGDLELVAHGAYLQDRAYFDIVRNTLNLFTCRIGRDGTLPVVGMAGSPCPMGPGRDKAPVAPAPLPLEASPVRLDSFSAFWVVALGDYVRYSGDRAYAREVLPVARRTLEFFFKTAGPDGLWRSDDYGGKTAMNWHTPDKAQGVGGFDNEAYYQAVLSLAALERSVAGDERAASALEHRAAVLRQSILRRLWDPQVGAMRLNLSDTTDNHPADANAAALRWRLLDDQQSRRVATFLQSRLMTPYGLATAERAGDPYMTRYISPYVEAQAAVGLLEHRRGREALDMVRASWGHMISQDPGVPWEEMSISGTAVIPRPGTPLEAGTDIGQSHAWSTVVPALSGYVLGIQPATDGYRMWSVRPQPVDLNWAEGRAPTPYGPIATRWRLDRSSDTYVLTVSGPAGTSGSVAVPLQGEVRTIAMDGRVVWRVGRPQGGVRAIADRGAVVFEGLSGRHTFAWAGREGQRTSNIGR